MAPRIPGDEDDLEVGALRIALSRAVLTDRGGRFSVDHLMPGHYDIVVRAAGSALLRTSEVATPGTDATTIELSLDPPLTLRGTCVDPNGQPIAGVSLLLRQDPRHYSDHALRWGGTPFHAATRSGPNGTFEFAELPPDLHFLLRAFKSGAGGAMHLTLTDLPLDGQTIEVQLTPK